MTYDRRSQILLSAQKEAEREYGRTTESMGSGTYLQVFCTSCGWYDSSKNAAGGEPTGGDDYNDIRCPVCDAGVEEVSANEHLALVTGYAAALVTVLRSEAECTVHRIRKPRIGPGEVIDEAFTHGG